MSSVPGPKIVTFYSYKGGTGRSMALANVAWILASNGHRVLVIDWDLEAPGLHRYLHPYLKDRELTDSTGVIDFVMTYARAAIKPATGKTDKEWYVPFANLLRHASSLKYEFPKPGTLDFIPAGRQGADYAARVNSFNWSAFYEKQQGGIFLEAAKLSLSTYDYVLIDSRTGVSDTSGICTVQMPHILVVCFTPNSQSIEGASAIARSADIQRTRPEGERTLVVLPVMTRVLQGEKERVEQARSSARKSFSGLLWHLATNEHDAYWGRMSVPQEAFYGFEEVLAVFADEAGGTQTMLASMEVLAGYIRQARSVDLKDKPIVPLTLPKLDDDSRKRELKKYVDLEPGSRTPQITPKENMTIIQNISLESGPESRLTPKSTDTSRVHPVDYLFYLSYSRRDKSPYLDLFFKDLFHEVEALSGYSQSMKTGFLDAESLTAGEDWSSSVASALAGARCFVPILSPSYIVNDYCGKEWQVFASRQITADPSRAYILPVLWVPFRSGVIPEPVSRIQWYSGNNRNVSEKGLQFVIRLKKFDDDYHEYLRTLAEAIVKTWDVPLPPAQELPDLDRIPNAFERTPSAAEKPAATVNKARFMCVVGSSALRGSSAGAVYGNDIADWMPFSPARILPTVFSVATGLNILPETVGPSLTVIDQIQNHEAPTLVLIDAWALKLVQWRNLINGLQKYNFPSLRYLVIFDQAEDTAAQAEQLLALVKEALPYALVVPGRVSLIRSSEELQGTVARILEQIRVDLINRMTLNFVPPPVSRPTF